MKEPIINVTDFKNIIERLADEISSGNTGLENLMLIGIQRRGADIAVDLATSLQKKTGIAVPLGSVDINLYRDDWTSLAEKVPHIGKTTVPANLDGKEVILVDDVLFSGRTARAAMEALLDYGRPEKIRLLVLIDRGHRELPICADYIGMTVPTERPWQVEVHTRAHDGENGALLDKNPD